MKRNCLGLVIVGLLFVLQPTPASAKIDSTTNTNLVQGTTSTVTVRGQFVDLCKRFDEDNPSTVSGSGVTARKKATRSGEVDIEFTVASNAAPGKRTVSLHYLVELSGFDKFDVTVLRKGRITDVDVPSPTQFFQQVDVTLNGENIGNADIFVLFPGISGATAELRSSTDTRAVVRLKFPTERAEATAEIRLFDKACGSCGTNPTFLYTGLSGSGTTKVTITGPNAVKEIRFPITGRCGNACFKVGDVFTIEVVLVRPAKSGITSISISPSPKPRGGELITWLLVPSGNFAQASPQTPYNPNGSFNTIRIPPGDESIRLNVQAASCPGSGQRNSVTVETWTGGNTNSRQPPEFKQQSFTIDCLP